VDELRLERGPVWEVVGEALGGGMTTVLGAGDCTFCLSRLKGILNREELMRSICGERRGLRGKRGRKKGEKGGGEGDKAGYESKRCGARESSALSARVKPEGNNKLNGRSGANTKGEREWEKRGKIGVRLRGSSRRLILSNGMAFSGRRTSLFQLYRVFHTN